MPSEYLKPALEDILKINPTAYMTTVDDVQTDNDKQLLLNVRDQLVQLTENLENMGPKPNLNLINRDYYQVLVELIDITRKVFVNESGEPVWTDFRLTQFGTYLLSVLAGCADRCNFMFDRYLAQIFAVRMTRMKYFFLKAAEYGFQPIVRKSAMCTIRFNFPGAFSSDVSILAGTQVSNQAGDVIFEVEDDVVLNSGSTSVTASCRNWVTIQQQEMLQSQPDTIVRLREGNVLDERFSIVISAQPWIRVFDFFGSNNIDKHYVVEFLEDESAQIRFGNGVNGAIPVGPADIVYKVGGGSTANSVQRGGINKLLTPVKDISNVVINGISVFNTNVPTGGTNRPTLAVQVPAMIRSIKNLSRTVTLGDYEDNVLEIPGIARAIALDRTIDPSIDRNKVVLYIVPQDGTVFSAELEVAIQDFFNDVVSGRPKPHNIDLDVFETDYQEIDLDLVVTLRPGYNTAVVTSIQAALQNYFGAEWVDQTYRYTMNWGFVNGEIPKSVISKIVQDYQIAGVIKVDFVTPSDNIIVGDRLFPRLRSLNIIAQVTEA